jgi:hypothetical protein
VRTKNAPQNMASMRNLTIGTLRADGWTNIAAALRWTGQPAETGTPAGREAAGRLA